MILGLLANAIVLSAVYVMFSTGFTLVYGSFRVMNMAHGAMLAAGAFIALYFTNATGISLWLAAVIGVLCAGLLNALMNVLVVRPIQKRTSSLTTGPEELTPVVATIAAAGVIAGVVFNTAGGVSHVYQHTDGIGASFDMFGVHLSALEVVIVAVAVIITVGLNLLIGRTSMGMRIRAVAEDSHMAEALAVRSGVIASAVFFISGALAGLTGVSVGLLYNNVNPLMGEQLLLLGFIIVTVGGVGSLRGTIIAAIIVAFIRTFASTIMSVPAVTMLLFGILLLMLIVRPSGIVGVKVLAKGAGRA